MTAVAIEHSGGQAVSVDRESIKAERERRKRKLIYLLKVYFYFWFCDNLAESPRWPVVRGEGP